MSKILKPTDHQETLNGWLIHSHKGRDRHDLSARYFEEKKNWLGIPAVILSTIVGTSVFASLGEQDENVSIWIKIIVGFLSVSAAVLSGLQTFHNYGERANKHRSTGVKYKELIRLIEETLPIMKNTRPEEINQRINEIRNRLDMMEEAAPVVPRSIYAQVDIKYGQVKFIEQADQLYDSEIAQVKGFG